MGVRINVEWRVREPRNGNLRLCAVAPLPFAPEDSPAVRCLADWFAVPMNRKERARTAFTHDGKSPAWHGAVDRVQIWYGNPNTKPPKEPMIRLRVQVPRVIARVTGIQAGDRVPGYLEIEDLCVPALKRRQGE